MRKQWIDEERPVSSVDNPRSTREDGQEIQLGRGGSMAYLNNDNGADSARSYQANEDCIPTNTTSRMSEDRAVPRQQNRGDDGDQGLFLPGEDNNNDNREHAMDEGLPEHDELDDLLREQEDALGLT